MPAFNLSDFGIMAMLNRMLNTSFKKEDIRSPTKQPHHEIKLVEIRFPEGGTAFMMQGVGGSLRGKMSVRRLTPAQAHMALQVLLYSPDNPDSLVGWAEIGNADVKRERFEAYHDYVVRMFFDVVRSVRTPRDLYDGHWVELIQCCEKRNKWID